ncbi:ABC transporter permease [Enterococcus casseliflavus]|uniref:ABC transporter permease n=1 Tax=Enterococcus casseliflavus TaxID=37734 RepID=UPI0008EFACD1|nr:ABC transporter permease [Enterococcus casseliflavus]MBO6347753.1 ABC transporter permease [Enterococcus casseliflavus]MBO6366063.1 ABC transporter permease [Enterococcus casseliflavus]MBZ3639768.1 ABC transporter permease [Enterococcus casseliflavus]MRI69396.1 ABC transporter permease [Enterococcus casseliflavus]SFD85013.1 peptide/nickel transport system permease protein [Enterococcus casseliflavus]
MFQYIVKRILWLFPILLGVSFIVFTIMYLSPGDPVTMVLGEGATPEQYEAMRVQMGLDRSFIEQFFHYIKNVVVEFDLGRSYVSGRVVMDEILIRLPNTIKLSVWSVLFASLIGIPLGVISASRPYSKVDNFVMFLSLVGVSMPTFWQALLLIILFTSTLGWLPASGFDTWQQMIMPVFALASSSIGTIARITRSSMMDVLDQDYIRTAKAKGVNGSKVTFHHALRNALIPVVTVIGLQFGALLGGAVLTETVFSINGIGTLMVNAIRTRDTMIVQGGVLFIAFIFTMVNLCVDILYAYIDPRIKTSYD